MKFDDKEIIIESQKNKENAYCKKRFTIWQLNSKFTYKNSYLYLSDTPSGCGPVQMSSYNDIYNIEKIDNLIYLISKIIENFINIDYTDPDYRSDIINRTPTGISFIQGIHSKSQKYFKKELEKLGFETKTYYNTAHGFDSDDVQTMFYFDIANKINEYKE